MVNLVTSGEDFPLAGQYAELLADNISEVSTVIRSINHGQGSVATGDERVILSGNGFITDRIGDKTFTISPRFIFPDQYPSGGKAV